MKEERILNLLNQVDEKFIKEADPMNKAKKKNNWLKWGAVAACLCLVLVGAFTMLPSQTPGGEIVNNNDVVSSSGVADVAPMVYVNNTLYKQSNERTSYTDLKDDFVYLGTVKSDITSDQSTVTDGVPKENFQSNTPIVGAEIYQYGDNIVVHSENAYWVYETLDDGDVSKALDNLTEEEKMQLDPSYDAN